jgi:hypothetical protein
VHLTFLADFLPLHQIDALIARPNRAHLHCLLYASIQEGDREHHRHYERDLFSSDCCWAAILQHQAAMGSNGKRSLFGLDHI